MTCRVIGRPAHCAEPLLCFTLRQSEELGSQPTDEWDRMTGALAAAAKEDPTGRQRAEIFLGMMDEHVPYEPNSLFLEKTIRDARRRGLGSDIYVVTASPLNPRMLYPQRTRYVKWIDSALEGRVADVLQLPYDPTLPSSFDKLFEKKQTEAGGSRAEHGGGAVGWALKSAAHRRHFLLEWAPERIPNRWGVYCDMERFSVGSLLEDDSGFREKARDTEYLLVVFDDNRPEVQRGLIKGAEADHPDSRFLAVTLETTLISHELIDFCQGRRSMTDQLLSFGGILELWHFFRRLQHPRLLWPPIPLEVRELKSDPEPVFARARLPEAGAEGSQPEILFTCAWNSETGTELQRASEDLGAILAQIPLSTRYRVDCAITPQRLARHAGWSRVHRLPLIWVHWGPCDNSGALRDVAGTPVAPEAWLDSFKNGELDLPLALFLSAGSHRVAERFAAAGAGVAVGFTETDLAPASRRLGLAAVETAVRLGCRREALLTALRREHHHPSDAGAVSDPIVFIAGP